MSGFNPDHAYFQTLQRLLGGDVDAPVAGEARSAAEGDRCMQTFLAGLQRLPTSLLGISLNAAESTEANTPMWQRADLETFLRNIVQGLVDSHELENTSPRTVIDRARDQFLRGDAARSERLAFFDTAGRILGDVLTFVASNRNRAISPGASTDTVLASGHTTIELIGSQPAEVLARQARLERLGRHDSLLALIYILHAFAGRTPEEIAELLEIDVHSVENMEQLATVEICYITQ